MSNSLLSLNVSDVSVCVSCGRTPCEPCQASITNVSSHVIDVTPPCHDCFVRHRSSIEVADVGQDLVGHATRSKNGVINTLCSGMAFVWAPITNDPAQDRWLHMVELFEAMGWPISNEASFLCLLFVSMCSIKSLQSFMSCLS